MTKAKKIPPNNVKKSEKTKKIKQKKPKPLSSNDLSKPVKVPKHNPADVENTVFIGNLPNNTKSVQVMKLLSHLGGSVKSVRLRTSNGRVIFKHKQRKEADSLNAYVVLNSKESLEKVLQLNGTEFKGNHIRVNLAKKVESEDTQNDNSKRVIFVGNLKFSATDEKLHDLFSNCGEIEYVRTLKTDQGCKGVAYVCFKKSESIQLALELNNTLLEDRPIRVEKYSKKKLGAHEKRKDVEKNLTGPARRLKEKGKKSKIETKQSSNKKVDDSPKNKKAEFRGVKTKIKKKSKAKKPGHLQILAKKIAPK